MQRCCKLAAPVGSAVTRGPRAMLAASFQRPGDEGKLMKQNGEIEIPRTLELHPVVDAGPHDTAAT